MAGMPAQGMTPLVIMTAEREYTIAADVDAAAFPAAETSMTGVEGAAPVMGYQAAYGSLNEHVGLVTIPVL